MLVGSQGRMSSSSLTDAKTTRRTSSPPATSLPPKILQKPHINDHRHSRSTSPPNCSTGASYAFEEAANAVNLSQHVGRDLWKSPSRVGGWLWLQRCWLAHFDCCGPQGQTLRVRNKPEDVRGGLSSAASRGRDREAPDHSHVTMSCSKFERRGDHEAVCSPPHSTALQLASPTPDGCVTTLQRRGVSHRSIDPVCPGTTLTHVGDHRVHMQLILIRSACQVNRASILVQGQVRFHAGPCAGAGGAFLCNVRKDARLTNKAATVRLDLNVVMRVWPFSPGPRPGGRKVGLVWGLVFRKAHVYSC